MIAERGAAPQRRDHAAWSRCVAREGSIVNPRYPAPTGFGNHLSDQIAAVIMLALAQAVPEQRHRLLEPPPGDDRRRLATTASTAPYVDILHQRLQGRRRRDRRRRRLRPHRPDHAPAVRSPRRTRRCSRSSTRTCCSASSTCPTPPARGSGAAGLGRRDRARVPHLGRDRERVRRRRHCRDRGLRDPRRRPGLRQRDRAALPGRHGPPPAPEGPRHRHPARAPYYRQVAGGGGGYGDPRRATPTACCATSATAYVSPSVAREVYGVAIDTATWAVDEAETARLRGG